MYNSGALILDVVTGGVAGFTKKPQCLGLWMSGRDLGGLWNQQISLAGAQPSRDNAWLKNLQLKLLVLRAKISFWELVPNYQISLKLTGPDLGGGAVISQFSHNLPVSVSLSLSLKNTQRQPRGT